MRKLLTTVSFVLLLTFVIPLIDSFAQQQRPIPTLDQVKAEKFIVEPLKGRPVELSKLIGQGKPVVIDFWATWCGPCRQEIPHLVELSKQYSKEGLIVVGLTLEDPQTERNAVKAFAKQFKISYTVAFAPEELFDFFNRGAPRVLIPQTYIFGADGKIIRRLIGYNERVGKEILTKAVAQAVSLPVVDAVEK